MSPWDREREQLDKDYASGILCHVEYMRLMREIDRDERDAMLEAAQDAYEREIDNWGGRT